MLVKGFILGEKHRYFIETDPLVSKKKFPGMSKHLLLIIFTACVALTACGGNNHSDSSNESPVAALYGFDDPGATQAKIRSDLPKGTSTVKPLTLRYDSTGCKFPSESPDSMMFGCPGYRDAKPKANGSIGWSGNLQQRFGCGGDTTISGDTWVGCLNWSTDNFFSLNNPVDTFWTTVTNTDPAYDQCNSGPPGASNPIGKLDGGTMFKMGTTPNRIILEASADDRLANGEWYCHGTATPRYSAPFLSVGAEQGKGQSRPIMPLQMGQTERLSWESRILTNRPFGCVVGTEAACSDIGAGPGGGVWSGIFLNSAWGGTKRGLFLMIHMQGHLVMVEPQRKINWSWPIADSFFYPGFELGYMTPKLAKDLCQMDIPDFAKDGSPTAFSLDVAKLMQCASDNGFFSQPITSDAVLTGVHWFVEFTGTEGEFRFTVENPQSK